MTANTAPIFSRAPDVQWSPAPLTAANAAMDGTGTVSTVFAADATEGGRIDSLVIRPLGTNVASVLRVFLNNGAANSNAANNALIAEMTLPSSTASSVAALTGFELPLNRALPPGFRINCTLGTAVAAGYEVTAFGSKY